jgi:hypothetical protein
MIGLTGRILTKNLEKAAIMAISPVPNTKLINMNEFSPWMDRGIGRWKSLRRYLFGKNRKSGEYTTDFELERLGDCQYRITWSGKTSGEMDLTLNGNRLERSRSYFDADNDQGYQEMSWIDSDTIVFYTAYDGTEFREEIRFLDNNTRLRQTVGKNQETGDYTLIGQYWEERVV